MKNTLETRLGMFVALAVIAAVLIMEVVHGPFSFQRGLAVRALFKNVQDLKKGDRVKMAGVEVGRVEKLEFDAANNKVLVTMRLRRKVEDSKVEVRTDSMATVKFTGLMGENYVALDFGSPSEPLATDGTMLQTTEQPDMSAIMAKIDSVATGVENLTRSFTGDKIDNLLGPFTDFLKANREPLTATIANMQAVSQDIKEGKGTIGMLVNDKTLYNSALASVKDFQDTATQAKQTLAEAKLAVAAARVTIDQVNSNQGTVGKLLHEDKLYNEATASMTNLHAILQKINEGQGSVGKIVNDQELYKNAKLTLQKLDQATEGLEDQGPLSILGTVVGKLF
jgi:phospholipid/cholesterol/gamma-HCH transport system substrate-binding protein